MEIAIIIERDLQNRDNSKTRELYLIIDDYEDRISKLEKLLKIKNEHNLKAANNSKTTTYLYKLSGTDKELKGDEEPW